MSPPPAPTGSAPRRRRLAPLLLAVMSAAALIAAACRTTQPPPPDGALPDAPRMETADATAALPLRSPAAFRDITDPAQRSAALFMEASRVLLHPRCVNCHPQDDTPRQGDAQRIHSPPVHRGPDNRGVPGMTCAGCHQDRNLDHARVPGAEGWHLAPVEMAWLGRGPREICAQLKDNARNGGKSLEEIHTHIAEDGLVAWGWSPGWGRAPAPGTQAEAAALVRAWIDTGAACPPEGAPDPSTPGEETP